MYPKSCQGFTLVGAVFILVVLSLAASFVVTIATVSHLTTSFAVAGSKALFAAKSGIQWAVFQVVNDPLNCFANTNLVLTQAGVSGYTTQVTCSLSTFTEGVTTFNVFTLTSIASRGSFGDQYYVQRQLQATVSLAP